MISNYDRKMNGSKDFALVQFDPERYLELIDGNITFDNLTSDSFQVRRMVRNLDSLSPEQIKSILEYLLRLDFAIETVRAGLFYIAHNKNSVQGKKCLEACNTDQILASIPDVLIKMPELNKVGHSGNYQEKMHTLIEKIDSLDSNWRAVLSVKLKEMQDATNVVYSAVEYSFQRRWGEP